MNSAVIYNVIMNNRLSTLGMLATLPLPQLRIPSRCLQNTLLILSASAGRTRLPDRSICQSNGNFGLAVILHPASSPAKSACTCIKQSSPSSTHKATLQLYLRLKATLLYPKPPRTSHQIPIVEALQRRFMLRILTNLRLSITARPHVVPVCSRVTSTARHRLAISLLGCFSAYVRSLHSQAAARETEYSSKMSAAEERVWNSLATGMDRFHQHFRYEFDRIYRVRLLHPLASSVRTNKEADPFEG